MDREGKMNRKMNKDFQRRQIFYNKIALYLSPYRKEATVQLPELIR